MSALPAGQAIECKQPPGVIKPVVDFNRCEGNADCVRVCPENIFAMARIEEHESRLHPKRRCLPLLRFMRVGLPREGDHAGQGEHLTNRLR